MRTVIVALVVSVLAACAAPTHIDGHKIRATAGSADDAAALAEGLHAGAPAWFTAWWQDYLRHAEGGHAHLALDRNGRGGWYVYCIGGACHLLDQAWTRQIRDVYYTYRARESCGARVGEAHPAARPDCALYAIDDKIVWEGPLPWEGEGDAAAGATRHAAVGAAPDIIGVRLALDMHDGGDWPIP